MDTLALLCLASPIFATTPIISVHVPVMTTAAAALLGGAWMGYRIMHGYITRFRFKTEVEIPSDTPPVPALAGESIPDALLLGYTMDTGQPVWLPYDDAMRHIFILGQSGVGKTVAATNLMFQQIQRGGGMMFVDGKMNADDLETIYQMCAWAGREHDLLVINPGNPEMSNSYNPILYGDPDEVASRIIGLIPSTESNPGADYYKQAANQGLTVLVAALQKCGLAYNFMDLTILLMSAKAMLYLENLVPESDESRSLSMFLDQYRSKDGLDMKRVKETFGGIGGRMFMFGTGLFGKICNTYSPDIKLFDAIMKNKIIYVMLPTMGKDVAAQNFGKMVIGDLRTAVSWVQATTETKRPDPPFLGFFDEAGSYVSATWSRMFEQARSARFILMPAVQTLANLETVSPELAQMIVGNTWTKLFFKLGTQESAEEAAEFIGKEIRITRSISMSDSKSETASLVNPSPSMSSGDSSGFSYGEREQEEYRVSPDNLKSLGKGECIVLYGGSKVYPIKIPLIRFDKEFKERIGNARINRVRPRHVKGIDLFLNIHKFLSKKEQQAMGD